MASYSHGIFYAWCDHWNISGIQMSFQHTGPCPRPKPCTLHFHHLHTYFLQGQKRTNSTSLLFQLCSLANFKWKDNFDVLHSLATFFFKAEMNRLLGNNTLFSLGSFLRSLCWWSNLLAMRFVSRLLQIKLELRLTDVSPCPLKKKKKNQFDFKTPWFPCLCV